MTEATQAPPEDEAGKTKSKNPFKPNVKDKLSSYTKWMTL